jgi:Uma2 family endonuclease
MLVLFFLSRACRRMAKVLAVCWSLAGAFGVCYSLVMSAALDAVIRSPRLPLYVEELTRLLDRERAARSRFRAELTDSQKAEFINGEVLMHSPAKYRHLTCLKHLLKLLDTHVEQMHLGWVGCEKVLVCLTRNDYEPDLVFYGEAKAAQLRPDQTEFPAPDLIVEVLSESTEARDRGIKFEDYASHGVREYWLVDPEKEVIEQYDLAGETYALRIKQADGTLRSDVVPRFTVPVRAIFDRGENLAALQWLTARANHFPDSP